MRTYGCVVSFYIGSKLVLSHSSACWSMLSSPVYFSKDLKDKTFDSTFRGNDIYISNFDYETAPYQELLISVINAITPCSIVEINKVKYIKYRMLATYDQNLIILSFIRNLWYEPVKGYTLKFFEALKDSNPEDDPLVRLTTSNKEACTEFPYGGGHSNWQTKSSLKIKTVPQLLAYVGTSTRLFLTTEIP